MIVIASKIHVETYFCLCPVLIVHVFVLPGQARVCRRTLLVQYSRGGDLEHAVALLTERVFILRARSYGAGRVWCVQVVFTG